MNNRMNVSNFIRLLLMLVISMLAMSQAYSQSGATLYSLDPDYGISGTVITLTGEGFTSTGNTVIFRSIKHISDHYRIDIDSPDGHTLVSQAAPYLSVKCAFDELAPCAAPHVRVTPGEYDVYVITPDGRESNRLTFTVPPCSGDVNGDAIVDIVDALLVAQYYVQLHPSVFYPEVADVTVCDGMIDIVDALAIARYYTGLIERFPCSELIDSFVIDYVRSGGVAGINEHIIIQSKEKSILINDRRRDVTDADINRLWDTLYAINRSGWPPYDYEPCCCDMFTHYFTISSSIPLLQATAYWTDCTESNGEVSDELLNFILIRDLIEGYIR